VASPKHKRMQFFQESCAKSQAHEENAIRLPTIQESSCTKSSEHKKRMQFFCQQFRNEHTFCGPGTGGVQQQHLCCFCKSLEEEQPADQKSVVLPKDHHRTNKSLLFPKKKFLFQIDCDKRESVRRSKFLKRETTKGRN
jgi:hypothetical protein